MDTYQPIYDAVRSRLSNGDIGMAIQEALRCDMDTHARNAFQEIVNAGREMQRPSVVFKPALSIDGNRWCALYGENLQDGVAGFGESPELAMLDFDAAWRASIKN